MKQPTTMLSSLQRAKDFEALDQQHFDVLIIGGGITGAGIALDASSRGLSNVLFEKQDFAAGTSSRSTKLIHGGLRYLKQLEIGLVREVGQERALLHRNAPHIVQPKQMLLPIIKEGSLGKTSTAFGLYVYDWLANVDDDERRTMHEKNEVMEMEPLLREDIIQAGGRYWEYQTDDARLTIEVLKTAISLGSHAFNYTEITDFLYNDDNKIIGAKIYDHIHQKAIVVYAQHIVNAAGPWVDTVRRKDDIVKGKRLHLTKGVHIVVPYNRLPLREAVYFDVQDGRMIFAIPRRKTTYIGTTDTFYPTNLSIEKPEVSLEDVEYLLKATNEMFPSTNLQIEDIVSSWVGLRPLIHEDGKSPSELSRKDEIFISSKGLISIAGGKLTGFRKMAERTIDVVVKQRYKQNKTPISTSTTEDLKLSGGNFKNPEDIPNYITDLSNTYSQLQITEQQIHDLVYKYGTNTPHIIEIYQGLLPKNTKLSTTQRLLLAELHYSIRHEMVTNLSDFLIRRTARLYFERETIEETYFLLLDELAKQLQWNKKQKLQYLREFEQEYQAVLSFIPQQA
jgi:glycerol-3-phosphate dehydrogenase